MLPYFLLVLIPLAFTYVAIDRSSSRRLICIGASGNPLIQNHNMALPVFFVFLCLMLACRNETVGRDVANYRYIFEVFTGQSMKDFDLFRTQSLYRLLNWTIGNVTDQNYQIFLTVVAMFTIAPIALLYCEDRRRSFMKIVLFVGMSTFVMLFSGIRQMMAVSLGIIAYMFVRKKKLLWFMLTALIALGFHHSAFMIILMYPLYHLRLKKNHLWFILPIMVMLFVFNTQIFGVMNTLLAQYDESYEAIQVMSTGAYMSLILFVAFAVFSYVVVDESQMDDELYGLRNFLLLTVVLQFFAPLHTLAMRMNYYYVIFLPITIAKFVDVPQANMKRIAKIAAVVITVYFLYDFISTIYTGYVTGVSALDTVPYIPFWK